MCATLKCPRGLGLKPQTQLNLTIGLKLEESFVLKVGVLS